MYDFAIFGFLVVAVEPSVVDRRSITIPDIPTSCGVNELLQEHRSVSQLMNVTPWSCRANGRRNQRLSQLSELITPQKHSTLIASFDYVQLCNKTSNALEFVRTNNG